MIYFTTQDLLVVSAFSAICSKRSVPNFRSAGKNRCNGECHVLLSSYTLLLS